MVLELLTGGISQHQHLLRLVLQAEGYFLSLRGGVPPEMASEEVQKHLQQQLDSALHSLRRTTNLIPINVAMLCCFFCILKVNLRCICPQTAAKSTSKRLLHCAVLHSLAPDPLPILFFNRFYRSTPETHMA